MPMIFTETENNYILQLKHGSVEELHRGLWLAIIGADEIPPHIALLCEGLYYSVSVKKTDTGTPLETLLKAVGRHSKPCIFIRITLPEGFAAEAFGGLFEKYGPLHSDAGSTGRSPVTCLNPIRDFFTRAYSEKYNRASFVFELLALAQEDGIIERCAGIYIEQEKEIILQKYTHREIREKINSLKMHVREQAQPHSKG